MIRGGSIRINISKPLIRCNDPFIPPFLIVFLIIVINLYDYKHKKTKFNRHQTTLRIHTHTRK